MESNTVVLKLERYHELLSFEERQSDKRNHTIYITNEFLFSKIVNTDKEAVKKIADELNESLKKQSELSVEIKQLKEKKEPLIIKEKNFFKYMKLFFVRSNQADA